MGHNLGRQLNPCTKKNNENSYLQKEDKSFSFSSRIKMLELNKCTRTWSQTKSSCSLFDSLKRIVFESHPTTEEKMLSMGLCSVFCIWTPPSCVVHWCPGWSGCFQYVVYIQKHNEKARFSTPDFFLTKSHEKYTIKSAKIVEFGANYMSHSLNCVRLLTNLLPSSEPSETINCENLKDFIIVLFYTIELSQIATSEYVAI